ncbi:MAG TPA: hypothetical protein PK156_51085, partial [Polyangium sp.]|nr:hypothetical protein [Polyangium sp.]
PRILTRLGLLGRYQILSAMTDLAQKHRESAPELGRACTLVVLPVYSNEDAFVEVGDDVAPHVGAISGTRLVPVPGILPHEILNVPELWVRQKVEKRPGSEPPEAQVLD